MHHEYKISGVSVLFPCKPYPSQLSMMDKIIKGIDRRQNCLIESPTGSGKSLALLCSSLAWQSAERAKQDQAEAEQPEKTVCTCMHLKDAASSPKVVTSGTDTSEQKHLMERSSKKLTTEKSEFGGAVKDDNDDFKNAGKNFNVLSKVKDRRKHISIMYENDQEMTTATCAGVDECSSATCGQKADQEKTMLCTCDASRTEKKPKTKISKIFFGTRTHKQVAQIVRELRRSGYHDVRMTILGSREHTCIHPQVSQAKNKTEACRELLNDQGCHFKDCTPRMTSQNVIKSMGLSTAWDLEDLVNFCKKKRACPYFLSRGLKDDSDLIICPYNYLVDPLVREAMQINLKGHVVILDEAHNIEDSAREAASQSLTQDSILKAIQDIEALMEANINLADHSKLRSMLKNLDTFIDTNKTKLEQKDFNKSYKIWTGFHIVAQLDILSLGPKQFPEYKKALAAIKAETEQRKEESVMSGQGLEVKEMKPSTLVILEQMFQIMDYLYRFDLKYVDDYRASLFQSQSYAPVINNGHWLNAKSVSGGRMNVQVDVYTLNFWCMNPAVAFSDFVETRSIILTSGTLSPLTSFESELGLEFKIQLETNHVIEDSQVWVGTLGQGPSGSTLQAVFRNLETFAFQDELGNLVLKVCQIVPHGVLCFLPSYNVLDKLMNRWESTGLKKKLDQHKLVIREPKNSDKLDFEDQLKMFYTAMTPQPDNLKTTDTDGAVFFAVCRGKVSEGLDFADNFARAVITVGVPYPNFKDVQVELKRKYNDQHHQSRGLLPGNQWYEIQAFRALNQALGRCIRHRHDWGALIIVDDRFVKTADKYCKGLSKWVRNKIQTFQDFSVGMESLSKFTTGQLALMDGIGSVDNSLCKNSGTTLSPQIQVNGRDIIHDQTVMSPGPRCGRVTKTVQPFPVFNTPGHMRTKAHSRSESPSSRSPAIFKLGSHQRGTFHGQNVSLPSATTLSPTSALRVLQDSPGRHQSPSQAFRPSRQAFQAAADVNFKIDSGESSRSPKSADFRIKQTKMNYVSNIKLEESSPTVCETEMLVAPVEQNSDVVYVQDVETAATAQTTFSDLNVKVRDTASEQSTSTFNHTKNDRSLTFISSNCTPNHKGSVNIHERQANKKLHKHTVTNNIDNNSLFASTHKHAVTNNIDNNTLFARTHKHTVTNNIDNNTLFASIHKHTVTNNIDNNTLFARTHKHAVSDSIHNHMVIDNTYDQRVSTNNHKTSKSIENQGTSFKIQNNSTCVITQNQRFPNEHTQTTSANDGQTNLQHPNVVACISQPETIATVTQLPKMNTAKAQLPEMNRTVTQLPGMNRTVIQHPEIVQTLPASNRNSDALLLTDLLDGTSHASFHNKEPSSNRDIPATSLATLVDDIHHTSPHVKDCVNKASKQTYMNKKFLFKPGHSDDKTISVQTSCNKTTSSAGHALEANPQFVESKTYKSTRISISPSVVANSDPESEDKIHIRRKNRGRKRKSSSRADCERRRSEEQDIKCQKQSSKTIISCAVCGHVLIDGIQQSDFQKQTSVPSFLREAENKYQEGALFFSGNASCSSLQDITSSVTGLNSKYVEQEEICVQFLHCGQCLTTSPESASAVGAQVKLAAGSGARFSKGQVWLFLSAVKQTQEQ